MKKILSTLLLLIIALFSNGQNVIIEDFTRKIKIDPQLEFSKINSERNSHLLQIDDNHIYQLTLKQNSVMSDDMKRELKNIKTYDVFKEDKYVGTYTWSEYGVWYYLVIEGKQIAVFPELNTNDGTHYVEFGSKKIKGVVCGLNDNIISDERQKPKTYTPAQSRDLRATFGEELREYRIYFATTGEFYELNGNNSGAVNAVITSTVQGLNVIYQNDLAVKFILAGQRVYTNSGSDPFIPDNGNGDTRTIQAGTVIHSLFSPNRYDIGHVLHKSASGGNDGWGSGGLAQLNSVCNDFVNNDGKIAKASGWSGSFNNSGFSWLGLIGHEIGHQFGAEHTFNGTGGSCTDNISTTTAYEIGSGTTIMSYNGICESGQNIQQSGAADNYFHVNSLLQMIDHITGSGDCAAKVPAANTAPELTTNPCNAIYNIPKITPFYLRASATDAEGDLLTYAWDQFDEDGPGTSTQGLIGNAAAGRTNSPVFRSFPPHPESYRYFPAQSTVINGNRSDPFDVLPAVARTVNMKLVVRDNHVDGGAIDIEDVQLNFINSGPLNVPGQTTWMTGEQATITWSTGGSDNLCQKADVSLSIDGGLTFPYLIANDVPYNVGSITVPIKGLYPTTAKARLKVACDDYECFYFYDISDNNFSIISNCEAPTNFICPAEDKSFDAGDQGLNFVNTSIILGDKVTDFQKNVNGPTADIIAYDVNGTSCKVVVKNRAAESEVIQVDKAGSYSFAVDVGFNSGFGFVSLFTESNYNPSNSCPSFVASSGTWSGNTTSVSASGSLTADLVPCTKYRLVFYNYTGPTTKITDISGPGNVIIEETMANPDFTQAYLVVNNVNNIIDFISMDPDFTSLPGGSYTVYAMSYKSGGPTPPNITDLNNYLGQEFNTFYIDGDCFLNSANSFNLEIAGNCLITSVVPGTTGNCDPMDNTFPQVLVVSYDVTPMSGELSSNGQTFPITSSPQTITVRLPSIGSLYTGEVFFTAEPNCKVDFEVQARDNCCPFELELGDTTTICTGDVFDIDAGDGGLGGTYEWYQGNVKLIETGRILTVDKSGTFRVVVTSAIGCAREDEKVIELQPVPDLVLPNDKTICDGTNTLLIATTNAPFVRWSQGGQVIQDGVVKTLMVNTGGPVLIEAYFDPQCVEAGTVLITANESPKPDLGDDVFLCEGEMQTLDGSSVGTTFTWFKNNVIIPMETSPMYTVDQSGTYKIEVTNDGGCKGTDIVEVTVEGVPTLSVSADVTICDGEATNLVATTQASLVKWFVNDVLVQSGPLTNYIISTGGTVKVVAGNSEACALEETIIVTANVSPKPRLGFDVKVCEDEIVRLSGKVVGQTYDWFKDNSQIMETDSFIFVQESGSYKLEVTNVGGCTGTDVIDVEFFALPVIEAGMDINYCEGTKAQINASSSSVEFFWFKDGQPYSEIELSFETTEPGTYVLEARNVADCAVFDTIVVTQIPRPVVDLGDDKLACIGDQIKLTGPAGSYTYQWFRNASQVATTKDLDVTQNGLYVLIVSDVNNCSAEDNTNITFEPGPTLSINENSVEFCQGEEFTASVTTNAPEVQWFKDGVLINGAVDLTLKITDSGKYTAQAEGAGGCIVTEEIDVTVNTLPNVNLDPTMIDCEGELITLMSNIMGTKYSWLLNGSEVSNMQSVDVSQAGSYTLIVTNQAGCSASDVTQVSFVSLPTITLDATASFCEGESISVAAVSNGGTFQWTLDGSPISGATSKTITISQAGSYELTATGQGTCANSKTIVVTSVSAPTVDLGNDITLCPGEMVTLNAGPNTGSTFLWSTGDPTASIQVNNDNVTSKSTIKYSVAVTNTFNCSTSDEVSITLLPIIVANITSANDGVCSGDSLILMASGGEQYQWNGPQGTFEVINESTIKVFPAVATDYTVVVSDQCPNNEDNSTINIDVFVPGIVSAGSDTCVLIGRSIKLKASGGSAYKWEDDNTIVGSLTTATPEVKPTVETTYKVIITDSNGCKQEDEVTVCVISDPLSIFKSVTAITPNGDGFNDDLVFPGLEAFDNKLVIYNRWGNLIYEKSNYQRDGVLFDGTRNGELLPPDTYYYVLTFDEFEIKETLTILRSK